MNYGYTCLHISMKTSQFELRARADADENFKKQRKKNLHGVCY